MQTLKEFGKLLLIICVVSALELVVSHFRAGFAYVAILIIAALFIYARWQDSSSD